MSWSMSGTITPATTLARRCSSSSRCSIIGSGCIRRSAMSARCSSKPTTLSPFEGVYGIGGSSSRPLFFAPSGEGVRNHWCAAPFGPFRQMVPDTLRPPYPCAPQPDDREPHDARPHVLVPPCKGRPIGHTDVEEVDQSDEIEAEQERKADQHADQPLGPPDRKGQHRCAVEEHGQEPDATVCD